jgi:hypothetical protein
VGKITVFDELETALIHERICVFGITVRWRQNINSRMPVKILVESSLNVTCAYSMVALGLILAPVEIQQRTFAAALLFCRRKGWREELNDLIPKTQEGRFPQDARSTTLGRFPASRADRASPPMHCCQPQSQTRFPTRAATTSNRLRSKQRYAA